MGEIAEGMINGDFDYVTGEYLGPGEGFPRTRKEQQLIHSNKRYACYFCGKKLASHKARLDHITTKHEVPTVSITIKSFDADFCIRLQEFLESENVKHGSTFINSNAHNQIKEMYVQKRLVEKNAEVHEMVFQNTVTGEIIKPGWTVSSYTEEIKYYLNNDLVWTPQLHKFQSKTQARKYLRKWAEGTNP